MKLKFSFRNSKLNAMAKNMNLSRTQVVSFDLPAGWTCPKADICKCFANEQTGKIHKIGKVLCYASKAEAYSPSCRRSRWHNFRALHEIVNSVNSMVTLINDSLPEQVKIVRLHSSGDFFSKNYFLAWMQIVKLHPEIIFFGYTKILDYALAELPDNFHITYSFGSKDDTRWQALTTRPATCFISEYKNQYPQYSILCGSKNQAHEDFIAIINNRDFALSIH